MTLGKCKVLLITEKSCDIRTFFRISDPDTDDDGAENQGNQGKTNGTTNSAPSINVSGKVSLSEFFDQVPISAVNVQEAKKNLEKPLLRRKSELPADILTQKSLENYKVH